MNEQFPKSNFNSNNTSEKKDILETQKKIDTNNITQETILEAENIKILPENKNEKGELLAPNGEVSNLQNELHWKMVRTESFKNWFGNWQINTNESSKIVDKNGEPIIVYHCSSKQFDGLKFDSAKSGWLSSPSQSGALGKGTYFTSYLKHARDYGDQVYFCFLNVRKTVKILNATKLDRDRGISFLKPPQGIIDFIKILPLSLFTPKGISAVMDIKNSEYSSAERYFEIAVPNNEDIMIIPSPVVEMVNYSTDMPWETGHNFLNSKE